MIIEYEPDTGRITHKVNDPVPPKMAEVLTQKGKTFLEFPPVRTENGYESVPCNIFTDYIKNGVITPRPEFNVPEQVEIVADGTDEFVLIDLPDPCQARVDGQDVTIEGGELIISSDMPAEYEIELLQWPYIPKTVKVIANEVEPD